MAAKFMNIIGTILVLIVIVAVLPLTVPKLFGYQIFSILTESMASAYPVGSAIYVKAVDPTSVQVGDVITFTMDTGSNLVTTHRVVSADADAREFITKGDENAEADNYPVSFDRLVGVVAFSLPAVGCVSWFLQSKVGIACFIGMFLLAIVLWIIAERLKKRGVT